MERKQINPLSRRPKSRRLVVAVRGAAGSGKSVFASSLADAGLGRLCFFDTERKGRLLPGSDGTTFDAIEIRHPDELLEFIDWALDGDGRAQNYGCFALDSWAMYFARKHRETLQAVRQRTDDPLAQPNAAALDLRVEGFEQVRVARVVKSNSPDFPVGFELKNPTFSDFLACLGDGPNPEAMPAVPEVIEQAPAEEHIGPTLDALLTQADAFGLSRADLLIAARHYCGANDLDRLKPAQIDELLTRMISRYDEAKPATAAVNGQSKRRRNGKAGV